MTVYLHTEELLELVEAINALEPGSGRDAEWVEAHGLCVPALLTIADSCAEQAIEDVIKHPDMMERAFAATYLNGVMLGLHAAERIGR